jgi:hypothetical protein
MIPNNFIDFYGDQTRWFLGEVVNVKDDPLKLGRVKVRVFGVYDDIKDEDLPWAQIVVPITQGVHEGTGQYLGILVGTQVFGMFLDGQNSQLPMVIGTVPKEGDANSKALENYPQNKVYETESGHYKEWDDTEGKERIREQHKSGTYYEIDKDGNMTIDATGDDVIKNITIKSSGQINVTAPVVNVNGTVVKLNS